MSLVRLSILGLKAERSGASEGEKRFFEVDLDILYEEPPDTLSDNLMRRPDLALAEERVLATVSYSRFELIEPLAAAVADEVVKALVGVKLVRVRVRRSGLSGLVEAEVERRR